MKNIKKKAFTLVELLVVIAILAILAAVSVVGYMGFTEKANKSVDEQLCTQYNTILKASLPNDENITLQELIDHIEENGIRANKFETKSKSYEFAYDINKSVVLLDLNGNVQFPKDYVPTELWTTLDKDLQFTKGVDNYTLLTSVVVPSSATEFGNYDGSNLTLDLNNYALEVKSSNEIFRDKNLNVSNGKYIARTAAAKVGVAVDKPEETLIDATSDGAENSYKIFEDADQSGNNIDDSAIDLNNFKETNNVPANTLIIKDKYFSNTAEESNNAYTLSFDNKRDDMYSLGLENFGAGKTVIFDNCTFSNVALVLNTPCHYVIRNCDFYNIGYGNYPLTIFRWGGRSGMEPGSGYTYEITGNTFNTVRSMNVMLPSNVEGITSKISGNTFNLSPRLTSEKENKSNAIQFSGVAQAYQDSQDFGDLEIKDNVVSKAYGFISMHDTFFKKSDGFFKVAKDSWSLEDEYIMFKEPKLVFSNNNYANASQGFVVIDPSCYDEEGNVKSAYEATQIAEVLKLLKQK